MEATMQEKIITQLQESLEAIQLTSAKSLELALQVLAWVKLSSTGELSDDLSLSTTLLDEPSRLLQVLTRLAQEGDLIGQAFANGTDFGRLDPRLLQPALTLALRLDQAGMLKNFDPVRAISSLSSKFSQEPDLPLEVTALLAGLAGGLPGEGVYVPWDSRGTLAASVTSADTDVYLESPILSAVPALISLLSDHRFQVHYADPIRNPSAVENGQLRQFDVAVAFPPMGIRYSADVTNNDWFSRFPEKTTSGAVLAILHLLRQAKRRVVIAVSNSLLFSAGAERSLREDLVRQGKVEKVISMPAGLLANTNIAFSILVLNPTGGLDKIQFINADTAHFRESVSKAKCQMINVDKLVTQIESNADTDNQVHTSVEDVLKNDAQLQVSRYVLPDTTKQLQALLNQSRTVVLKSLVSTVRPMPVTSQDDDSIGVWEIGAADLPPYGYISTPGRALKVEPFALTKHAKQFLRPLDIVLIVKGSVGKVGIVPHDVPPPGADGWVAGQSAIVLRADATDPIDPRALFLQLRSELGRELLSGIVSGATIQLIQLRELERLEILLPDAAICQQAIEILEKEARLQKEINHLRQEQSLLASDLWSLT